MPAIRTKTASTAKSVKVKGDDYDDAINVLKQTLKITPKTAKHICITLLISLIEDGMGYTTPSALANPKIMPEALEVEMQAYLERTKQTFQSAPKRSGAMYRVAFRRILWTARASEEEKKMRPERLTCAYWSNKAISSREAKAAYRYEKIDAQSVKAETK
jgi:hypothetical protein